MVAAESNRDVIWLFHKINRNLKVTRRQTLLGHGLNVMESMVLLNLHGNTACRMTALAEMMDIPVSTLSGMIDKLEERGLVTRVRSDADRRAVTLSLTPMSQGMIGDVAGVYEKRFSEYNPLETEKVMQALYTLNQVLDRV